MQAYQQIANLSVPNGTSGLLIASPSQYASIQQQQHHHQQTSYQELVKAYLPQLGSMSTPGFTSLSASPTSSSPSSSLSSQTSSSMASFAVRLMSLNAHELKCLNSDSELMRHIHEAQVLIDNKLHDMNSKSSTDQLRHNKQQLNHHHSSPNNLTLVQQHQEHQMHLQQQQHLLMSTDSYYQTQNYYAQQLALSQMAQMQQHQQQQQLLLMDPNFNYTSKPNVYQSLTVTDSRNDMSHSNNLTAQHTSSHSEDRNGNAEHVGSSGHPAFIPALDLRTTPTRPVSETPSPKSVRSRSGSIESTKTSRHQQHPKKAKLTEYRQMQQSVDCASDAQTTQSIGSKPDQRQHSNNLIQYQDIPTSKTPTTLVSNENFQKPNDSKRLQQSPLVNERVHQNGERHPDLAALNSNIANTRSSKPNQSGKITVNNGSSNNMAQIHVAKKHKGEFDEPSPCEVAEREKQLSVPDHYHRKALEEGTCACVIGSEWSTKKPREALEQLDQWRALDIEQRIKWKWDLNDLPKDIPLSNIKKFEDLRRDFSNGRADFGGASKRKPLGIRGTRQFLLMLYCLWGHPGREDPMQQDGYCPHCFAKIRTENEQSTLVRVVNHFNMKHRRGANPRLSPETRATTTPQDHLICETLKSVVETAIASTEDVKVEK